LLVEEIVIGIPAVFTGTVPEFWGAILTEEKGTRIVSN